MTKTTTKDMILNKLKAANQQEKSLQPINHLKHKVGDKIQLNKNDLKVSYTDRGIKITTKDNVYILWRETNSYMDLIPDTFEVVVKKINFIGNKQQYICRLALLEDNA